MLNNFLCLNIFKFSISDLGILEISIGTKMTEASDIELNLKFAFFLPKIVSGLQLFSTF